MSTAAGIALCLGVLSSPTEAQTTPALAQTVTKTTYPILDEEIAPGIEQNII